MTISELFDKFVLDNAGKPLEVEDPSNRDQCFDLALGWCDVLGIPREAIRHLNASQIWTNPLDSTIQYFDYIPNTPNGKPKKGDIIVFGGNVGHVSVASGIGDTNTFTSFDQNFPLGSPCHLQTHDYKSVLGWLRPKTNPEGNNTELVITDQTHLPLFDNKEQQQVKAEYDAKDRTLKDNEQRINDLNIANSQQYEMIVDYQKQISKLNDDLVKVVDDFNKYKLQQESISTSPNTTQIPVKTIKLGGYTIQIFKP